MEIVINKGNVQAKTCTTSTGRGKSQEGVQAGNSRRKVVWKPV